MPRRLRTPLLAAGALLAATIACSLDETSGLSERLGEPLLDIAFGAASDGLLPTATYTLAASASRDTLTLVVRNLSPLPAGAVYQMYLADSASAATATAQNLVPVAGRIITQTRTRRPVNRDSTFTSTRTDTAASATAITAADTNQTRTIRIIDARIKDFSHVVFAVEPAAVSATGRLEAGRRFGFLWSRYRVGTTYTNTGTLTFGTFAIQSALRVPYSSNSATISGAFRGGTVRANIRDLVRPPQGFQYAGWLIDSRTGRAVRLGPIQTPVPDNQVLTGADTGTGPYLTEVGILEAQLRGDTATAGGVRWEDFTRIVLLLEPKGSAAPTMPGGAFILAGPVPQSVSSRSPGAGKLFGTVTGGTAAQRTDATVFLTGASNPTPVLVANADATGVFRFRTVPVGAYRAYLVPKGGSAPVDSANVTINSAMVNGAAVGDSVNITLRIP